MKISFDFDGNVGDTVSPACCDGVKVKRNLFVRIVTYPHVFVTYPHIFFIWVCVFVRFCEVVSLCLNQDAPR